MGKFKEALIEMEAMMMEKLDRQYRPFQPATRLDDVQVLGATVKPVESLLEGREWVPSTQTDVTRTWRKFGWRPIAEIEAEKALKGEM
jgi:hypothetical protein